MNTSVKDFLKDNNIKFITHEHPPIFTCEEAEKFCSNIPGIQCKNLLLKEKKTNKLFLIILPANKRASFGVLEKFIGSKNLTFASEKLLGEKMGLEPGSVSPFGLLNNKEHDIEVYIDNNVYFGSIVSFHPNRNTASLELSGEMFRRYLKLLKNKIKIISL